MAKEKTPEDYGFHPATLYKRLRKKTLCLSTGLFPLDMASSEIDDEGFAGIRERDVVEYLGPNNSLKTAAGIAMIVATQKRFPDKYVAAVFSEPFDPDRLEACGVDLERLRVYNVYNEDEDCIDFANAEKACNAALHIVQDEDCMMLLLDSVAALVPKGLLDKEFGGSTVALLAKIMNEFIVKFKALAKRAILLMINHYKEKINTTPYALDLEDSSKLQTPGGRGAEFLSDFRVLFMSSVQYADEVHSILGVKQGKWYKCKWIVFKNKYCPGTPHRTVKAVFDPKTSKFNNTESLLDWACMFTVKDKDTYKSKLSVPVHKAGSWITVGSLKTQGIDKMVELLDKEHPELVDKLMKEMYKLEGQFFDDKKVTLEEFLEQ